MKLNLKVDRQLNIGPTCIGDSSFSPRMLWNWNEKYVDYYSSENWQDIMLNLARFENLGTYLKHKELFFLQLHKCVPEYRTHNMLPSLLDLHGICLCHTNYCKSTHNISICYLEVLFHCNLCSQLQKNFRVLSITQRSFLLYILIFYLLH